MASITSLGIGSGLDLSGLVSGLLAAERRPLENSLNRRESSLSTELSGIGLMRSAIADFRASLSSLSNADNFKTRALNNSNADAIEASVTNEAAVGDYSIDVGNLAQRHALASTAYQDINEVVGTGTMTVRFGSIAGPGFGGFTVNPDKATRTITIDSSNNTLSGLRDYINQNDFGFSAAIINDGTGYRLTLTSDATGEASAMEITVADDDGNDADAAGLSNLAYNATAANLVQTQAAEDAQLTVNGLAVTSSSNVLDNLVEGLSLTLKQETAGTPVKLGISETSEALKTSIESLVEDFNSMIGQLNDLGKASENRDQAGLLAGDATLRNFVNSVRRQITSPVPGVPGEIRALVDIGISTQRDGTLELDGSKLNKALSEDPDAVKALFAPVGKTSDSQIRFADSGEDTVAGVYRIQVDQLASRGSYGGTGGLSFPLTIDADNDEFAVSINGISSGPLTLTQGSYADGNALATEIQSAINSSGLLVAAGVSVSVDFDAASGSLTITSSSFGSNSTVSVDSVDTNTAATLGLSVGAGTAGTDVAGSIGGSPAEGKGQRLTAIAGDSAGLALDVLGGPLGARGTVSFSRGFIEGLNQFLGGYLDSDGVLSTREDGLNKSLEQIQEEREQLERRMAATEERLIAQFSALDTLLAQFQNTSTYLSQQLNNLPGSGQLLNKK
jgi:flagellar hook-associated protein 2